MNNISYMFFLIYFLVTISILHIFISFFALPADNFTVGYKTSLLLLSKLPDIKTLIDNDNYLIQTKQNLQLFIPHTRFLAPDATVLQKPRNLFNFQTQINCSQHYWSQN